MYVSPEWTQSQPKRGITATLIYPPVRHTLAMPVLCLRFLFLLFALISGAQGQMT